MAQAQTYTNTFVGGMLQNVDPHEQPNSTLRYSIGGRISVNRTDNPNESLAENTKWGKTRAYANAKGNSFLFSLCPGYQFVGSVETRNGAMIFSTNGISSEIGYLEINDNVYKSGAAKYITLFNDFSDPNFDRLNFSVENYIHGYSVYENEFIERQYVTDGNNQKRVFNLPDFYNSEGVTYHDNGSPCNTVSTYPKHLSVHAFDEIMDLVFPRIKFKHRIKGGLKSGQYQVVMKYKSKSGHSSVWSHIGRPVFVTDQKMDGELNGVSDAYQTNHHNRTMGASNVMTEEGQRWELTGLDTRWDYVVVGYIYHATSVSFQEANEYKTYENFGQNLTVDLLAHTGTSISQAELSRRNEVALSVGTTAQQENRNWDADIRLIPDMTMDFSEVKIKPHARYYRADNTMQPEFVSVENPVSGRDDNDPITNTAPEALSFEMSNFTGDTETYSTGTVKDYNNYKGQLFNYLFKAYFRGETNPWAIVVIDRKGNPTFAQHITDYTFPNQFDTQDPDGNPTDWTLTRHNTDGRYEMRIMGAMFSNIKIPADKVYDKFGKLNISGFMIVRTKRLGRIANQGILVNANVSPNYDTDNEGDAYVHPMIGQTTNYDLRPTNPAFIPNMHKYIGTKGTNYHGNGPQSLPFDDYSAAGFFNYHSPDILIERNLNFDSGLKGQLQKVGFAHGKYVNPKVALFGRHQYSKIYHTQPLVFSDETVKNRFSRAKLKSKSRIKMAILHDQKSTHKYEKFDPETADKLDYRVHVQAYHPGAAAVEKSTQQPYSVIMKLLDWKLIDSFDSLNPASQMSYPIVNWTKTESSYYTENDQSSLEKRIYFSTGHFQPITNEVLGKVKKTYKPNGQVDSFVFDDVEVFGGDCYNTIFDFTRMYPEYTDCGKDNGSYTDYSLSLLTPIESKYNLALLYGRKFAANAIMPMVTSCNGELERFSNGIMPTQPEEWNYNEVLLLEENTKFYSPKPSNIKIVENEDTGIRWSPKKTYGESEDSYRIRLPLDYSSAIGEYGRIMRFAQGFDYLYVIQEKAFGGVLTRMERMVPSDTGEMVVKSGDTFSGVRYISKTHGTQHRNSVWQFDNNIGFTDARMGKQIVFNQAGLKKASETENLDDLVMAHTIYFDKKITHKNDIFVDIVSGIDYENSSVYTTFLFEEIYQKDIQNPYNRENEVKSFTLEYNMREGNFHGHQHFVPRHWMNIGRFLLAPNNKPGIANQMFLYNHGKYGHWYGDYYDTVLQLIVNPQPNAAKVFDNAFINIDKDAWKRIKEIKLTCEGNVHVLTASQIQGLTIVHPDDRIQYIESLLRFPLHEIDREWKKERLRGHYLVMTITIDNSQQSVDGIDQQVAITNIDTRFRISHPLQY